MPQGRAADAANVLWQIGKSDHDNQELALAPNKYPEYREDGFMIPGRTEARQCWPYVHPGPGDAWAGSRPHTFTVLFGLKKAARRGEARLKVDLIDAHYGAPPKLEIDINGQKFERQAAPGKNDDAIQGQPSKGTPSSFDVVFPASVLRAGDNTIRLTSVSGSWMLYDALSLEAPAGAQLADAAPSTHLEATTPVRALRKEGDALVQDIELKARHFGEPLDASIRINGGEPMTWRLKEGSQTRRVSVPEVKTEQRAQIQLEAAGKVVTRKTVTLKPVRKMVIYILPHSHTDIGYTDVQPVIEDKQVQNLVKGLAHAKRTADYPAGAQFKWNVEVLWAADLYQNRMNDAQRKEFVDAVRKGWVGLNGMYLNELTGLCRPEELVRLFRYATQLGDQCHVPVDSVMISDVPGYTWASVTAMAHAGIRYFSTAPNYFDRIGDILAQWENKPFYWVSPSGREKVMVWIPYKGYAMSHVYRTLTPHFVDEYQEQLEKMYYPYDIAHMRWSGHGDNAEPDPAISEFVKDWATTYAWPKFIISTTSEAFHAFESQYGPTLPRVKGDWTPYWEDGAGSSSLETAMNRASSDRLAQAESLWAMLSPATYPAAKFTEAWNSVLLYSEHTWGAWCSVSDPEHQQTRDQWKIKRGYALRADEQSRALMSEALRLGAAGASSHALEVVNTASWPRTELVTVPQALSGAGDYVTEVSGGKSQPVPSQRLSTGELVFLAGNVPAMGSSRYVIGPGDPFAGGPQARVRGSVVENGRVRVRVDETTGAIVEFTARGMEDNLVDTASGHAINDYLYLPGDDLRNLQTNGKVTLRVKEAGPLVAALEVESAAPGCRRLVRQIRVTAGFDHVELFNLVDKERAAVSPKPGDWGFAQKGGKESVNFAFPFNVPDGETRLELPLALMNSETDQIPSACKNWFTVGSWADVSNARQGVTWVSLDAPLVQVGGITATLTGSQSNPDVWRKKVERTQKLYAWVMNNHWGTNYRAYQEGPVLFRFILLPHRGFNHAASARFAGGYSQPLLVRPAGSGQDVSRPLFTISPSDVLVSAVKPSDDGRAVIVRLFGASDRTREARLKWHGPSATGIYLSNTGEHRGEPVTGPIRVPAQELVSVRVELK